MVSTARHRFELRLFEWAEERARSWCGGRVAFFVALREDGSMRRIYFASDEPWDGEQKTSMARSAPRWFLYVPGEAAGEGYVEWSGLPVSVVRTWTGRGVGAADLADLRGGEPLDHWPEGWRVVLA